MPISCQEDPHIGANTANDPALMANHCWGLDILEPIPRAIRGYRYLYVAINKFTNWSEVTPVVKINKQSTVKFIKSIIYRFGVPNQ
jgi:hypothetical protein